MEAIKQETINKSTDYLNHIRELVDKNGSVTLATMKHLGYQHNCSGDLFYYALELGYFTKTGVVGKYRANSYKSNIAKFEPFHSRKVLELKNQKSWDKLKQTRASKKSKKGAAPTEQLRPIIQNYNNPKTKTLSILWGLIEVNY